MFHRKPKETEQSGEVVVEEARPMSAEETIRAVVARKQGEALLRLDEYVDAAKADIQKWAMGGHPPEELSVVIQWPVGREQCLMDSDQGPVKGEEDEEEEY